MTRKSKKPCKDKPRYWHTIKKRMVNWGPVKDTRIAVSVTELFETEEEAQKRVEQLESGKKVDSATKPIAVRYEELRWRRK
jgi:hypothetical protein